MKRRNAKPTTESDSQDRELSLAVLALMRRKGLSFDAACNEVGIERKTALRHIGSQLRQAAPGGRYVATPHDHLPRTVHFITPGGPISITVHDSRIASRIAEYLNAVKSYFNRGNLSSLDDFKDQHFEASGATHQFVTDQETLDRLADAGLVSIEGLYQAVQG
jgi:hypothetical protein